jgi:hypothetical protein
VLAPLHPKTSKPVRNWYSEAAQTLEMTLVKYENSCKWVVYHLITFASLSMFWFLINSISCFCTYHLKTWSRTGGKTTLAGSYQPPNQLRTLSRSITDCLQIGFGVAVWLKTKDSVRSDVKLALMKRHTNILSHWGEWSNFFESLSGRVKYGTHNGAT